MPPFEWGRLPMHEGLRGRMSCTVLIVDDSRLARMVMAKVLTSLHPDWTRVEAADADQALEVARRSPVDIAFMDFNMPGRDGLQLAAELRAISPTMRLAVISANSQDEIVARTRDVGAAFLSKPITERVMKAFLDGDLGVPHGRAG
jgi:CheY-like chemotaxis protein